MQQQQKIQKRGGGRPSTIIVLSCLATVVVLYSQLPLLFSSTLFNGSQDASASELSLTSTLISNCPVPTSSVKEEEDCSKNFFELASEIGTDKVTSHAYQHAYELYLPALRHTSVKMMEIGLGCDMAYGPGKSLDLWDRYFTHLNTSIFFIEYHHDCAKKWEHPRKRVTVDTGDQANVTFLNEFLNNHGFEYDIIIDDGGHTMVQQITSFQNLFPSLRSGGLYFLEDLQTSYWDGYGGGYLKPSTAIEYIKGLIDAFYGFGPATDIIGHIQNINCFHEVCVFTKK
jgi:hypothetical protein